MKNNTMKRVTRGISAIAAIVLAFCATTVTPVWACPPPEKQVLIATPNGIGTESPGDDAPVTTLPQPPLVPPFPASTPAIKGKAISAEISLSGAKKGSGITQLDSNQLQPGYIYAIDGYVSTVRPVKNLSFTLSGIPQHLAAGERATINLKISYQKKGINYTCGANWVLQAAADLNLDNHSTIFNSNASKGVYTRCETADNGTLSYTFESSGITPKNAFTSATVWLTTN